MSRAPASMRLDRLLGNLGYGSRRDVQALVAANRVLFDTAPVGDASLRVALSPDLPRRLAVDGEPLDPLPGLVLGMNKPVGVTCSHKEAGPLVYGLLPERWRRRAPALSTVGRLDKDTSGLLLLTDDGALLHRIIAPKARIEKRYLATLDRPPRPDAPAIFASGALLLDGEATPLLPAKLEMVRPTQAIVSVTEGRYHQIRRMFVAVGSHVEALHRDRIGGLALPEALPPGRFRPLSSDELAAIFAPLGTSETPA